MTNPEATRTTERPDEIAFSFEWYEKFLDDLTTRYDFAGYGDTIDEGTAVLRHDVDLSPECARRMAAIEARHGVRATYFFMVSSPMYNVLNARTRDHLAAIRGLGHDVGLHFSTHQYWAPDDLPSTDDAIAERVGDERRVLSTVTDPIETVSFHIPPDGMIRREFAAFPSTYEPRFFSEIGYCGDSNHRWRTDQPDIGSFDDRMQILVHPGLWSDTDADFDDRVRDAVDETESRASDYAESRYIVKQFG